MKIKYLEIAYDIKQKIKSGVYQPLDKLPSEHSFANYYNCSRLTARRALQTLIDEKYIISRNKKGYFVSMNRNKLVFKPKNGDQNLMYSIQKGNLSISKQMEKEFKRLCKDAHKYNEAFNFCFYKKSINKHNKTFTVLRSFLNTDILGHMELSEVKESLSAYFIQRGIRIKKRIESFTIEKPPKEIALKLDISSDNNVVVSYSIMFDKNDTPIEMAIRYTRLEDFKTDVTIKYL